MIAGICVDSSGYGFAKNYLKVKAQAGKYDQVLSYQARKLVGFLY